MRKKSHSKVEESWWENAGWTRAEADHPVRFLRLGDSSRRWTRFRTTRNGHGGVAFGVTGYADGSGSSKVFLPFVANPYSGPDLRSFIANENDGTGAASGDRFEFGDPEVMAPESWTRLEQFMGTNPVPPNGYLSFTKHWIYVNYGVPRFGPNEATAYVNYLDDVVQAIQGKPTSGISHARAIYDGSLADKSKAQKKVATDG